MSNQLRRRYDIIINGGGIVGSSLLNLILKSPYLSSCKESRLLKQASRAANFKQPSRLLGALSGSKWNQSKPDQSSEKKSSNGDSELSVSAPETSQDVPEDEFVVSAFNQNQLVPEHPIKSLNIVKRISRIEKKGSFTSDIFTGAYDHDFLTYPEPLDNRIENKQLKDQANMVKQLWPQIWDDHLQLQKYNFHNLYQLSVSEMMTIFEAIGASSSNCLDLSSPSLEAPNERSVQFHQAQVSKTIIALITRNCLTYWPMFNSENDKIRDLLPKRNIFFDSSDEASHLTLPIGFCWTERADNLGSLPPQEWLTVGHHGGTTTDHYLIQGKKSKVLVESAIENYLVYFRDKLLSEKYEQDTPEDETNPASDPFVGCCLLHKSELKFGPIYYDSAGLKYTDVELDVTVPGDRVVFHAQRNDPKPVNIKALGQVASCSVILGILKDAQRKTYKFLMDNKRGLLDCDIIERKLATATSKIFALESMIYYIAGMYDGLEDGFDAHMEATILKIVSSEFAYEILQDLQQVAGSELFIISKLQDQINTFDSFLDGNIYNRLYLATMGIVWFARSKNMHLNQMRLAPWYPGYFVKTLFKETSEQSNWLTLNADIYGNLHPSLKEAGVNLEYIIKRVKHAAEVLCMKYGKDVTSAQSALYRLAQLSIDVFLLTTMCARASKSYCNGSRNSEWDVTIATTFSYDLARKTKFYMEEIQITPITLVENRAKTINELNIKMGGYYAESPLDPNI